MAEEKPKGEDRYKSIFSMGQYDMERYNEILKVADKWSIEFKSGNMSAARPLFACWESFYNQIRELVLDKEGVDKLFSDADKIISNMERILAAGRDVSFMRPMLKSRINELERKVHSLKQLVGLGIEVEKVLSRKKIWERAARISHD